MFLYGYLLLHFSLLLLSHDLILSRLALVDISFRGFMHSILPNYFEQGRRFLSSGLVIPLVIVPSAFF